MNGVNDVRPSPRVDFFLSDLLLSDQERAIRDRVRAFAERQLRPVARQAWEAGEFPVQLMPELAALEIAGGTVSGYECPALTSVAFGLALQELSRVDSSFATFFNVQAGLSVTSIATCGSEEQKALAPAIGPLRGDRRVRPHRAGARQRRLSPDDARHS